MIKRYIGLCRAAGGIVTGFDLVLGEIRSGRARLVLIASDASDRTKKQLTDKCKYYNVNYRLTEVDSITYGEMIGKSACVALSFNGKGCLNKVEEYYSEKDKQ